MKTSAKREEALASNLHKALSHPARDKILAVLNDRVASPKELSEAIGESVAYTNHHVTVLKKLELIELVKTERHHGTTEHFYRATSRYLLHLDGLQKLHPVHAADFTAFAIKGGVVDVLKATEAGTLDAQKEDFKVIVSQRVVDREGYKETLELIDEMYERMDDISARSLDRIAGSGEEGFNTSSSLFCFKMPANQR